MDINISQNDKEVLAVINGRLDTVTSPKMESSLMPYVQEGHQLILDCSAMDYVSSAGLRVILILHKSLSAKGGKLILRHLNKDVQSVFDMTGFSRILSIEA